MKHEEELCNKCKRGKYQGECRHCQICYCGRESSNGTVTKCHHHVLAEVLPPEKMKTWEPKLSPEALAIQGRKRLGRKV